MTPKEKAIELIDKFKLKQNFFTNSFIKTTAKECALIAVDEIINSSPLEPAHPYDYVIAEQEAMEFWQKVKQEIENL
jgi:hypothetical protein